MCTAAWVITATCAAQALGYLDAVSEVEELDQAGIIQHERFTFENARYTMPGMRSVCPFL